MRVNPLETVSIRPELKTRKRVPVSIIIFTSGTVDMKEILEMVPGDKSGDIILRWPQTCVEERGSDYWQLVKSSDLLD